MPENPGFRVSWSAKAIQALRELALHIGAPVRSAELGRVVRAIDARLRRDPLNFGEAYRIRGIVQERLAVREFIAVDFAVDQDRRFALVRTCQALSGHGW